MRKAPPGGTTRCCTSGHGPSGTPRSSTRDARYGELWVGVRPSLAEIAALTGLDVRHLDELAEAIRKDVGEGGIAVRVVRAADESVDEALDAARGSLTKDAEDERQADAELARAVSELRLVKDAYEIEQMRLAVAATARGFEDIVRALTEAARSPRGERVVETAFEGRARREGNGVGYDTIAAAGAHACTLHWIRNDGEVHSGDLVLVDAGVEVDSLYTADVTRTLPVSGRFSRGAAARLRGRAGGRGRRLRGGPARSARSARCTRRRCR